jgi:hypothetical protein
LGAMVWLEVAWKREPQYKGRTLSAWGAEFRFSRAGTAAHREAEAAICEIGTNALPFLLARVRYERPRWKGVAEDIVRKLPQGDRLVNDELHFWLEWDPHENALACFEVLGPKAKAAIPELNWMMTNSPTSLVPWKAATSLASIGGEGLPSLVAVMTNQGNRGFLREVAAHAIGGMGSNAAVAVPALVGCLLDTDSGVARSSAIALGRLGLQPEITVPGLTNSLGSPSPRLRACSAMALGRFGPRARLAVPALVRVLDDPSLATRRLASNALVQIAPEVLTNRNGAERR